MSERFSSVLLSPLSEDSPAGEYLKSNRQLYRPLRNAYNVAQTSLHKLSLNPDPSELEELLIANQENWTQLEIMLLDILQNHSRDLECLAWMAMAQLFSDQPYVRLAKVLTLTEQTIATFWPDVQPRLPDDKVRSSDEDGIARERAELQSRSLKLLFGESEDSCQMAVPLRMLPLVEDIDYVRYQRDEAELRGNKQALRPAILNNKNEITDRINGMQDVLDALEQLDKTLQQSFSSVGMTAPGSRFLRDQVEANLNAMQNLTEGVIVPWPPDVRKAVVAEQESSGAQVSPNPAESGTASNPSEETSATVENGGSTSSEIMATAHASVVFDRDQAFHQLRMLANFFQQTEPQSPVSYVLEKAIRWGYTPLPELMRELLQGNDNILDRITDLTGMNRVDKTPIPGEPATSFSMIPAQQTASATATASVSEKQESSLTVPVTTSETGTKNEQSQTAVESLPDFNVINDQVKPEVPEANAKHQAPPSSGPAGLAITNLDDLI